MTQQHTVRSLHKILLALLFAVGLWSVIAPKDIFTWWLEVFPALIGVTVVVSTYNKFRLTDLVYILLVVHASILFIGGHYTYAEMPLFNWLRDTFHLERNYYDRLGHLAQGFIPALVAREVLLRKSPLVRGTFLSFIIICICLAISAAYELIEWFTAILTGSASDAFLGTQGDIWDTQWDMFCALIGSITGLLSLSRLHDDQLKNLL